MPLEWMRISDYFVDYEHTDTDFVAVDDDTIVGRVHWNESGRQAGTWTWSMTFVLPGPPFEPRSGVEARREDAARRVVQAYTALKARATAGAS